MQLEISKFRITKILFVISLLLSLMGVVLLILLLPYLPSQVPLWYTKIWGEGRLAAPWQLFLLPVLSIIITATNAYLTEKLLRAREKVAGIGLAWVTLTASAALSLSLIKIITLVALPIPNLNFLAKAVILPAAAAFLLSLILAQPIIKLARKFNLVTDPEKDKHPAMLLEKPTPRAGAAPIILAFLITGLIFLPITKHFIGIYLGALIALIGGILDDRFDLNPYTRLLFLMPLAAAAVVGSGVGITYLTNPFDGIVWLNTADIKINFFGEHHLILLADLLAFFWVLWMMNMLAWSDGVDGQFPGIAAIAGIVIGLLSLRLLPADPSQEKLVTLAFITTGAALGILPYTWHPCRILLGSGDTAVGLILASLAILSGAKIATAILILIVPTLDALYAIIRRVGSGHSPVWGDRGHLHHKLLELGWGQRKIAVFYWFITALFGYLALISSGKTKALAILTGSGLAAFILVIVNSKGKISRWRRPLAGLKFPEQERLSPEADAG